MKATELLNFINNNGIEWHYVDNEGEEDVLIFPYIHDIQEFSKMIKSYDFCDGGVQCILKGSYFAIWMKDICDYYGIELSEVFENETNI